MPLLRTRLLAGGLNIENEQEYRGHQYKEDAGDEP